MRRISTCRNGSTMPWTSCSGAYPERTRFLRAARGWRCGGAAARSSAPRSGTSRASASAPSAALHGCASRAACRRGRGMSRRARGTCAGCGSSRGRPSWRRRGCCPPSASRPRATGRGKSPPTRCCRSSSTPGPQCTGSGSARSFFSEFSTSMSTSWRGGGRGEGAAALALPPSLAGHVDRVAASSVRCLLLEELGAAIGACTTARSRHRRGRASAAWRRRRRAASRSRGRTAASRRASSSSSRRPPAIDAAAALLAPFHDLRGLLAAPRVAGDRPRRRLRAGRTPAEEAQKVLRRRPHPRGRVWRRAGRCSASSPCRRSGGGCAGAARERARGCAFTEALGARRTPNAGFVACAARCARSGRSAGRRLPSRQRALRPRRRAEAVTSSPAPTALPPWPPW